MLNAKGNLKLNRVFNCKNCGHMHAYHCAQLLYTTQRSQTNKNTSTDSGHLICQVKLEPISLNLNPDLEYQLCP